MTTVAHRRKTAARVGYACAGCGDCVAGRCFWFCLACEEMRLRIEIPARAPDTECTPENAPHDDLLPENVDESEGVDRVEDEPSRWRLLEID